MGYVNAGKIDVDKVFMSQCDSTPFKCNLMIIPLQKTRFKTINIVLISLFSALWIILNFTVAPLGFQLFRLPILHGVITLLIVLLGTWATAQYGPVSAIGIIGSSIVLLAGGPLPVIGFAIASILFDFILLVNHHKLSTKTINVIMIVLATLISSYFAGVINGIFILNQEPIFAMTIWGGWTIVGGIIGAATTMPIIAGLEKANVKKVNV